MSARKVLLAGHFSTIGDIESLDIVRQWVRELDLTFDVAPFGESVRRAIPDSIEPGRADPNDYSHVVMICGPLWEQQLAELHVDLEKFRHCVRIGINLTLITAVRSWNPFDVVLERDSDRMTRPDLTLLSAAQGVPVVVGRCMVRKQSSYAGREQHERARALFDELINRHDFAALDVDTRWYRAGNGLRTAAHFTAALGRLDLLLTNRLHGMVYALKAGVPVVAIDAIEGGAKLSAQARVLGWPQCIGIESATPERLDDAVTWCFSAPAARVIENCRERGRRGLGTLKNEFIVAMKTGVAQTA
ncbi:MAG: polysaccharide pyruvyl transferase family protein [Gammaproteobacteria bacterium]